MCLKNIHRPGKYYWLVAMGILWTFNFFMKTNDKDFVRISKTGCVKTLMFIHNNLAIIFPLIYMHMSPQNIRAACDNSETCYLLYLIIT